MYQLKPVGVVRNQIKHPDDVQRLKHSESVVDVFDDYSTGLFMTETFDYLDILFNFHLSQITSAADDWMVTTRSGEKKGVFASRSPLRPNLIGVTTVKVIERNGNRLKVSGLDAVDGTPVLDIKACDTSVFEDVEMKKYHTTVMKNNPRVSIRKSIIAEDTEKLLLEAGKMHGHYCPGLAMGVMAATRAMQELDAESDGLEDLLAIVETNNCLADGVQFVTGCSFGNNSLIYHDVGKTAITLTKRSGKGFRVVSRPDSQAYIRQSFPEFDNYYEEVVARKNRDPEIVAAYRKSGVKRSFGTLKLDFDRLFDTMWVEVEVPEYAPSHDDEICHKCGESVMASRVVKTDGNIECLSCSDTEISVLDGHGIHHSA